MFPLSTLLPSLPKLRAKTCLQSNPSSLITKRTFPFCLIQQRLIRPLTHSRLSASHPSDHCTSSESESSLRIRESPGKSIWSVSLPLVGLCSLVLRLWLWFRGPAIPRTTAEPTLTVAASSTTKPELCGRWIIRGLIAPSGWFRIAGCIGRCER